MRPRQLLGRRRQTERISSRRPVTPHLEVLEPRMLLSASPAGSAADVQELAAGNNAFAFDFYQAVRHEPGNLFLSPLSISAALAMTYAGARGMTAEQMADVLHFALGQDRLHAAFGDLIGELTTAEEGPPPQGEGDRFVLNVANSVWGQEGYPFLPEFLSALAEHYDSPLRPTDFISDPEGSRQTINQWVSDETYEKIKDLLPQGSITELTRMVLANAIYFNASWKYCFDEALTASRTFHLPGGDVTADMMQQTEDFRYAEADGYQAVELPYFGDDTSMVILLPAEGQFEAFEASLSAEKLDLILDRMSCRNVQLSMPKFDCRAKAVLNDVLKSLGMTDAFVGGLADFSGMDGSRNLFISKVIHEACIALDEAGTEAAAATAVVMEFTSVPPPPVPFTADRPFIYLIRHLETDSVLFVGRLCDAEALVNAAAIADTTGPRIAGHSVIEEFPARSIDVEVTFDEPVNAETFTPEDVSVTAGPLHSLAAMPAFFVPVTAVTPIVNRTFRITFEGLETPCRYDMVVGPQIEDASGNEMDQDLDGLGGEPVQDAYAVTFCLGTVRVVGLCPAPEDVRPSVSAVTATLSGPLGSSAVGEESFWVASGAGADGRFGTPDDPRVEGSVSYEAASQTVTFTPQGEGLAIGWYAVCITEAVADAFGFALDGEWPGTRPGLPSGDGTPGGAFVASFTVARAGDANLNGTVGLDDVLVALGHWQASGEPATWRAGDVNGDRTVDLGDIITMIGNWHTGAPVGGAAAGTVATCAEGPARPAAAASTGGATLAGVPMDTLDNCPQSSAAAPEDVSEPDDPATRQAPTGPAALRPDSQTPTEPEQPTAGPTPVPPATAGGQAGDAAPAQAAPGLDADSLELLELLDPRTPLNA